jgi:broad specificity phosphatase PhoE
MALNVTTSHVQRIWLVRHGQTVWNEQQRFCSTTDIPLSPLGRRQARHVATQLQRRPITAMYSSDMARAIETAEIIARSIQRNESRETARVFLPLIITSPAWREIAFGTWEGLTYSEIAARFPEQLSFFTDPEFSAPPEGESLHDVLQRVYAALMPIIQQSFRGEIVIVSHGGVLRGLLCSLLGMPLHNQWRLRVDTGSLSAIDVSLDENGGILASLAGLNVQL